MIVARDGGHDVDLKGFQVVSCMIDFGFCLNLELDQAQVHIRISSPFMFRRGVNQWALDPEERPSELGPVLHLCRAVATAGQVDVDGSLNLSFEGGDHLQVSPDDHYEAWTLTVTNGPMLVSCPGGDLAIFDRPT